MKTSSRVFLFFLFVVAYVAGCYRGQIIAKEEQKQKQERVTIDPNDDYRYKQHCAGC